MKKNKSKKKNKQSIHNMEVEQTGRSKFQKFMMWFLSIALIVSMVLPAVLGFVL